MGRYLADLALTLQTIDPGLANGAGSENFWQINMRLFGHFKPLFTIKRDFLSNIEPDTRLFVKYRADAFQ